MKKYLSPFSISTNKLPTNLSLPHPSIPMDPLQNDLTLEKILANRTSFEYFQLFLREELSEENAEFYHVVLVFRAKIQRILHKNPSAFSTIFGIQFALKQAKDILSNYILQGAPQSVNIDSATRTATEERVESFEKIAKSISESSVDPSTISDPTWIIDVFNDAKTEIYKLMNRDSFPRYLQSQYHADLLSRIEGGFEISATALLPPEPPIPHIDLLNFYEESTTTEVPEYSESNPWILAKSVNPNNREAVMQVCNTLLPNLQVKQNQLRASEITDYKSLTAVQVKLESLTAALECCKIVGHLKTTHPILLCSQLLSEILELYYNNIHIDKFFPPHNFEESRDPLTDAKGVSYGTVPKNKHPVIDFQMLQNQSRWVVFNFRARALRYCDLSTLTSDMKLPFFLNLYNTLVLHICVLLDGLPTDPEKRNNCFSKYGYQVGPYRFTLSDIQDGILRRNAIARGSYKPQFLADGSDPRINFILNKLEPRIHFALGTLACSSPAFRVFSTHNLEEQLKECTQEYLNEHIVIDRDNRAIQLPRIIRWYEADLALHHYGLFTFPYQNYLDKTSKIFQDIKFYLRGAKEIILRRDSSHGAFDSSTLSTEEKLVYDRIMRATTTISFLPFNWFPRFSSVYNGKSVYSHKKFDHFDALASSSRACWYYRLFLLSPVATPKLNSDEFDLYMACRTYPEIQDKKSLKIMAKNIYKFFLKPGSKHFVDIGDESIVSQIQGNIKKPSTHIFDAIISILFTKLGNVIWKRFVSSVYFAAMVNPSIDVRFQYLEDIGEFPTSLKPNGSFSGKKLRNLQFLTGESNPSSDYQKFKDVYIMNDYIWDDPKVSHPCSVVRDLLTELVNITVSYFHLEPEAIEGTTKYSKTRFLGEISSGAEEGNSSMLSSLMVMSQEDISDDAKVKMKLVSVKSQPNFLEFAQRTGELSTLKLFRVEAENRRGFFINLYNLLSLHLLIELGTDLTQKNKRNSYYTSFGYRFEDIVLTLNDIEHGILRNNTSALSRFGSYFRKNDSRRDYVLPCDWRLHFAITNFTESFNPLMIFDHEMKNPNSFQPRAVSALGLSLDEEEDDFDHQEYVLEHLVKQALARLTFFFSPSRTLYLPRQVGWYGRDFSSDKLSIVKKLYQYFPPVLRQQLRPYISSRKMVITFQYYDFSWKSNFVCDYDNHRYGKVIELQWPFCGAPPHADSGDETGPNQLLTPRGGPPNASGRRLSSTQNRFNLEIPGSSGNSGSQTDRAIRNSKNRSSLDFFQKHLPMASPRRNRSSTLANNGTPDPSTPEMRTSRSFSGKFKFGRKSNKSPIIARDKRSATVASPNGRPNTSRLFTPPTKSPLNSKTLDNNSPQRRKRLRPSRSNSSFNSVGSITSSNSVESQETSDSGNRPILEPKTWTNLDIALALDPSLTAIPIFVKYLESRQHRRTVEAYCIFEMLKYQLEFKKRNSDENAQKVDEIYKKYFLANRTLFPVSNFLLDNVRQIFERSRAPSQNLFLEIENNLISTLEPVWSDFFHNKMYQQVVETCKVDNAENRSIGSLGSFQLPVEAKPDIKRLNLDRINSSTGFSSKSSVDGDLDKSASTKKPLDSFTKSTNEALYQPPAWSTLDKAAIFDLNCISFSIFSKYLASKNSKFTASSNILRKLIKFRVDFHKRAPERIPVIVKAVLRTLKNSKIKMPKNLFQKLEKASQNSQIDQKFFHFFEDQLIGVLSAEWVDFFKSPEYGAVVNVGLTNNVDIPDRSSSIMHATNTVSSSDMSSIEPSTKSSTKPSTKPSGLSSSMSTASILTGSASISTAPLSSVSSTTLPSVESTSFVSGSGTSNRTASPPSSVPSTNTSSIPNPQLLPGSTSSSRPPNPQLSSRPPNPLLNRMSPVQVNRPPNPLAPKTQNRPPNPLYSRPGSSPQPRIISQRPPNPVVQSSVPQPNVQNPPNVVSSPVVSQRPPNPQLTRVGPRPRPTASMSPPLTTSPVPSARILGPIRHSPPVTAPRPSSSPDTAPTPAKVLSKIAMKVVFPPHSTLKISVKSNVSYLKKSKDFTKKISRMVAAKHKVTITNPRFVYRDPDGDEITIKDNADLREALNQDPIILTLIEGP